ncbi:MAG: HD domain-containing protein [Thermoanaerobaculum sp.]|nr:HD domain-containing protein [Thermoanaerobaculum sp.]MDW7968331.1 HD domain-containing phosphohydrolase [Thermoanaerobaculum sp.]
MRTFRSSILYQLTFSHGLVALILSLALGVVATSIVWVRTRAVEGQLLDSSFALISDQLTAQVRRLEETRDGVARVLASRPLAYTTNDLIWLHEIVGYTDVDRIEVFSDLRKLIEAYALLPGGSPEAATQWLPSNPQVAALLQAGQPVTWVQLREKGLTTLKAGVQVFKGGSVRWYVVVTLALQPSLLTSVLPTGMTGVLFVGDRPIHQGQQAGGGRMAADFLALARRETVMRLDDDTSIGLELTAPPHLIHEALAPMLQAGFLLVLVSQLLALLLGHHFARRLLSPLHDLLEGTAAMARGHLTVRLPVRRQDELGELTREFNRMADEIRTTYLGVIATLAEVVEAKSHYTREHIERVERLTMATAQVLEERGWARWSSHQKFILSVAAILHDVGKIQIGNDILNKPGPLSGSEREEILSHPEVGATIVERMGKLERAAEIIRACHEHYDGSGYPRGLKGEEIPLEARIILAVDAFDAMTQARPYSKARALEDAIAELRAEAGRQFDPVVVEALIEVVRRGQQGEAVGTRDSSGFYRSLAGHSGEVAATPS